MVHSLEGLRGIAALMVALFHFKIGATIFSPIRNGYLMVDLFFVLSGFVICAAYFGRLNSTSQTAVFMVRRFGRLFPLLIFSTLLFIFAHNLHAFLKSMLVMWGFGSALNDPGHKYLWPAASEVLSTLTLTHGMGLHDRLVLNPVSWSISVEFYTYIVFALLCISLPRKSRVAAFTVVCILAFAVSLWASAWGPHQCLLKGACLDLTYDFGFTRCLFSFFLGTIVWRLKDQFSHSRATVQVVSLALISALFVVVDAHPIAAFMFPFAFALLIWSMSTDSGYFAKLLATRPFQVIGARSYSIYMLHPVLGIAFAPLVSRVDGALMACAMVTLYLLALIVLSGLTYRFVEVPAREFFNSLAKHPKKTGASSIHARERGIE